jgi:hypothetical protein
VTRRNRGKRPGPRGRPVAPLFTTNRAAAHGGRVAYAKNSAVHKAVDDMLASPKKGPR